MKSRCHSGPYEPKSASPTGSLFLTRWTIDCYTSLSFEKRLSILTPLLYPIVKAEQIKRETILAFLADTTYQNKGTTKDTKQHEGNTRQNSGS